MNRIREPGVLHGEIPLKRQQKSFEAQLQKSLVLLRTGVELHQLARVQAEGRREIQLRGYSRDVGR